jgi:hypothetical protein
MGQRKGSTKPEPWKEKVRRSILDRQEWVRETAHLREAVEAGNERLAVFLVRELIRSRKEAA